MHLIRKILDNGGESPGAGEEETSIYLNEQLNKFQEILFCTLPETLEQAVGKKNSKGKYISTAMQDPVPESSTSAVHWGVIAYSSQNDFEFLELAIPLAREIYLRVKKMVDSDQVTAELLTLWVELAYYCGRIETYWLKSTDKITHLRGGKSNKINNNVDAQKVWYSQMILVAQNRHSNRSEIDRAIEAEIRNRIKLADDNNPFNEAWYRKFFNDNNLLSESFTSKRLYKSVYVKSAENLDRLSIPEVRFSAP